MGRAEELFSRIKDGGAAEIQTMVANSVVEELFLDYKRAATNAPFNRLDASDRRNLSKGIAGFANSEGGVIIWGVDCRRDPTTGADIPTGIHPIAHALAFKTLLDSAISGVTLPAHGSVENFSVTLSGSAGCVVTHIPIGMHVPYRTLVDKEEYYIRAGSNFVPTPHMVLAGLFGQSPLANLELIVRLQTITGSAQPNRSCRITMEVSVFNSGRGIADDLFLNTELKLPVGCHATFVQNNAFSVWRNTKDGRDRRTMMSNTFPPLPPGAENQVMTFVLDITRADADIIVDLDCGIRRGPGTSFSLILPQRVLAPALEHYTHAYQDVGSKRAGDAIHETAIQECLKPRVP